MKAYSNATKLAIENNEIVAKEEGYLVQAILPYEEARDFEYFCIKNEVKIVQREYNEFVTFNVEFSKAKFGKNWIKKIKENFQKMEIELLNEKYVN